MAPERLLFLFDIHRRMAAIQVPTIVMHATVVPHSNLRISSIALP